jgi:hypothetical protein
VPLALACSPRIVPLALACSPRIVPLAVVGADRSDDRTHPTRRFTGNIVAGSPRIVVAHRRRTSSPRVVVSSAPSFDRDEVSAESRATRRRSWRMF